MGKYMQHFTGRTPQGQPMPEMQGQTLNRAGGWVFQADDLTQLRRFLILGSEDGSYYATARELTREAATCIDRLLEGGHGKTVVDEIVAASNGRAIKNDPSILALALCLKAASDVEVRRYAAANVNRVVRTGSHMAQFVNCVTGLGGWGPLTRKAVAGWIEGQTPSSLAYQWVKYRQREGWRPADLLRLSHPKAPSALHGQLYDWMLARQGGAEEKAKSPRYGYRAAPGLMMIQAYEEVNRLEDPPAVARIIIDSRLPWEAVPSKWAKDLTVQSALFSQMPMTATLRQLGRLTALGLLVEGSAETAVAVTRLTDTEALKRSRVHPMAIYLALRQYKEGGGRRGHLSWTPIAAIEAALESAFFMAFGMKPRNRQRTVIGIDCSGSMLSPVAGMGVSATEAACVMAYLQSWANPAALLVAFSTHAREVRFQETQRLRDIEQAWHGWGVSGGTDCALPIIWARQNLPEVQGFCVWTDDETWAGSEHPVEALGAYRQMNGVMSRLVVASMVPHDYRTAGGYDDAGMMHVVGLDASAPQIVDDFLSEPAMAIAEVAR